ncbi:heavy metal translocating P-type ATPase [Methanobrevibacter sp. DSM 116169]|uniref:heavy metal translocating P-type ATPase n=1 Tax=Methanobrevibacter sp. DSM 116169 TaxID=3242727 RepID=UPI0038FC8AFD
MKFEIVYDKGTRIRLRLGRYAFNQKEGYGLSELILKKKCVKSVITTHTNGSILIEYDDVSNKNNILKFISGIGINDIYEAEGSEEDSIRAIDNEFYFKLTKKLFTRLFFKIFLPIPMKNIITIARSFKYLKAALNSILHLNMNVDLLDGLAIGGTLIDKSYSSTSSIMFLLSISDLLEEYTVKRTKNTLENSLALNIDNVWVVDDDGNEISQAPSKIKKGDKIKIRTGEIIPVDGKVLDGESMVNEASMTGEPLAIQKNIGKTVHAGTFIEEGNITVEVDSVNEDTRINKIVKLIEDSENLKANVQSKAERLADTIVPFSLLTTAIAYLLTKDFQRALSVLTVDFSCAIKLATPLVVISAMREASNHKLLVKGGKFLEAYAQADTIVFDKTGTLTNASPKVAKVIPLGKHSREEILKMGACIEEHYAHSVARAIVKQAEEENLNHAEEHAEVEYIVAHGIVTHYGKKKTIIGSKHFVVDDENVKFTKKQEKIVSKHADDYSIVYLAIGKKLEGIFCIEDPVRDEAKSVIAKLKNLGIKHVVMLTGDSENAASHAAKELGIDEYRSQVLPDDKSKIIDEFKSKGNKVIMVGDGINDSPALSCADVSVSMKNSSDIAREVADISLLSDDLNELITLKVLSQKMLDKINNNYKMIVSINSSLIGLGVLGTITHTSSSLLHNLSTMGIGLLSIRPLLNEKELSGEI